MLHACQDPPDHLTPAHNVQPSDPMNFRPPDSAHSRRRLVEVLNHDTDNLHGTPDLSSRVPIFGNKVRNTLLEFVRNLRVAVLFLLRMAHEPRPRSNHMRPLEAIPITAIVVSKGAMVLRTFDNPEAFPKAKLG